ncbi:MAG: glycosyltransferase [Cyclobacteriaceae bacterium]|nr:glycosyltransferase [Cyclobacteriaceae bacterium]
MKPLEQTNVLLLIPDLGIGGAERAISRLSVELAKVCNVYLCRFTDSDTIIYPVGGQLLSLNEPKRKNFFQKLMSIYFRATKLKKIKKDFAIHYSISFLEGANYINILSRQGERTIISLRGSILHDKDIRGIQGVIRKRILIPLLYRQADRIVALSEGLKHELYEHFGVSEKKIEVIYNHLDVPELEALSRQEVPVEFKNLLTLPTLIMSGRLHQQKGHREFLHVFKEVRLKTPCRLVIFGDGVLREKSILCAKSLQLKTYDIWSGEAVTPDYDVYFMGYVKNPFHLIAASTIFVFPSLYEGLGNALVEALACKITIIATDCHSGPREVLAPGTTSDYRLKTAEYAKYGILMPVLDNVAAAGEWISVLEKIINNVSLRETYSFESAKRLYDFDMDLIMPRWKSIIGY